MSTMQYASIGRRIDGRVSPAAVAVKRQAGQRKGNAL